MSARRGGAQGSSAVDKLQQLLVSFADDMRSLSLSPTRTGNRRSLTLITVGSNMYCTALMAVNMSWLRNHPRRSFSQLTVDCSCISCAMLRHHSKCDWLTERFITCGPQTVGVLRPSDVSGKVLSFTVEFLSFFYRNTVLSSSGEAAHQMCSRGSVVGGA